MNEKWYIQIVNRRKCVIYCLFVLLSCLFFSYIYYEIQCGVNQSHEELASLIITYMKMYKGSDYYQSWTIMNPLYHIVMYFFGLTYKTQRIVYSIMFFGVSLFTFDLCLRNKRRINLGNLPIYILLMVFLHLSGNYLSQYFGDGSGGTGYYSNYPFSLHINSTFCIVLILWSLKQLWTSNFYINKKLYVQYCMDILLFVIGFGLCGIWDWELYVLYLVFPYILLKLRPWLTQKKVYLSCFLLAILSYIVISVGINNGYIKYLRLTEIKSIYDLREQISYFLIELLCLYNIDITISDIMMIDKVVYCFRFIILFFILYFILFTIKNYFKKQIDLQPCDILISWGICIFAIAFIFTNLGYYDRVRYMVAILPYGTILLCNNSEKFLEKLNLNRYSNLSIICCIIMICSINKDWNKHIFDTDIARLVNLIEVNELHSGYGTLNMTSRLSVMSEGKHMAYGIKYNLENDTINYYISGDLSQEYFDYFIFDKDKAYGSDLLTKDIVISHFGNPNEIIEYKNYVIMIYREGLSLNDIQKTEIENSIERKYYYYNVEDLEYVGNTEKTKEGMLLKTDAIQFGPYIDLNAGKYIVKYEGTQLDVASVSCYSFSPTTEYFNCDIIYQDNEKLIYSVIIPTDSLQVEFFLQNKSNEDLIISDFEAIWSNSE